MFAKTRVFLYQRHIDTNYLAFKKCENITLYNEKKKQKQKTKLIINLRLHSFALVVVALDHGWSLKNGKHSLQSTPAVLCSHLHISLR